MYYQASKQLEQAIIRLAPRFTDKGTICNNWQELQQWHTSTGYQYAEKHPYSWAPIAVHTAGTGPEHNIFSNRVVHYAFRAWHDYLHLILNADFSNSGEYRVCCEHVRQLRKLGIGARDRRAVWAFTAGEVAHYNAHKTFIDYKREFVRLALIGGIQATVALGPWDYLTAGTAAIGPYHTVDTERRI